MFFHVGVLYFRFSCNKCFIRIAILCACGSRRFNPPTFFGRKIVFLAICSCLFFQIYLKNFSCVICDVCRSIGNTLLRKEVFDSISVFAICTFPLRESIRWESLFMCLVIFSIIFVQFCLCASCKFSLKSIPNILIVWYRCFIFISLGRFELTSVLIGSTIVLS